MTGGAGQDGAASPALLSETGLFADLTDGEELASGVLAYVPRFELWSDGSVKRRWLWLPPQSRIDTSDMDFWGYPVGTRAWKEFSRDGIRVETRFMEKRGPDEWFFMAYRWNAEQTDALAVPRGLQNASNTDHDIPSQIDCGICHDNMPDRLLGISAIQLSHESTLLTLDQLARDGRLTEAPASLPEVPGDAAAVAALGYLHANCGPCHNTASTVYSTTRMELWLAASSLSSVEQTNAYRTTVSVVLDTAPPTSDAPAIRILPGEPEGSAIYYRMTLRERTLQMPPVATELVDATGSAAVANWIRALGSE